MGVLKNKIALVTGAGQGLGKDIAKRFSSEGATVIILDSDQRGALETADDIGGSSRAFFANIADESSVTIVVRKILDSYGKIDILINNAATLGLKDKIVNISLEEWERVIRVNLTGTFIVSKAVLPNMIENRKGIIINIASQLGSVAIPNSAAYCSSKGGILQFTRALSLDHARDGIRVNSISPGVVITEKLTRIYGSEENIKKTLAPKHPIGRVAYPSEISGAALFLASEDASFMTGSDLVVDGGYLSQ